MQRCSLGFMAHWRWKLSAFAVLSVVAMISGSMGLDETAAELDSGEAFPNLESMLHWAIGQSDGEKLKDAAMVTTPDVLAQRRENMKEFLETMRVTSDADLMKLAIEELSNDSLAVEDRQRALNNLIELVEPLHNANDLDKLGGLAALVKELERAEAELRTAAAWAIGKASQNNPVVQAQALTYKVLPKLMSMVRANTTEEALKAFYAVSALVRNHPSGQESFYLEGGAALLKEVLSNHEVDPRLAKKCLDLVGDLADELAYQDKDTMPDGLNTDLKQSVVALLRHENVDVSDAASRTVQSLAGIP